MPKVKTTNSKSKMKRLVKAGWTLETSNAKVTASIGYPGLMHHSSRTTYVLTRPTNAELRRESQ
jgi:ribosomal protein L32